MLLNGFKFDLRVYVMVTGTKDGEITAFLADEGLARFCTQKYKRPMRDNFKNIYMHLTNYAINKDNEAFEENQGEDAEDEGHKRSLRAILEILA